MKAIKLTDNIYWVGGIDWDLRNFHGYLTPRGTSYNAFLIIDEKVTLIDTVKHYLVDEMLERISSVIDPKKIDYLVCNHVEMDHSGGIPAIMDLVPNATVITSPNGEKGLKEHYRKEWNFKVVKGGDSISIGKRSLSFVLTPMIHWPDNMVTYCPEEKLLFSNDSFGQHIASPERFDDEFPVGIMLEEAKKYYGNIVLSYNTMIAKALETVAKLDIATIAPSHGLIWRAHIPEIIAHYADWAHNKTKNHAVIAYDTMWESTDKIAKAIRSGFENKGVRVWLMNLTESHISDVMTEIVDARYICIGSPTLNSNMLPTVGGFLTYLKSLSPKNRTALAFGSYGWGGQGVDLVEEDLIKCGFQLWEKIKVKYIPTKEQLQAITRSIEEKIA